ncbi:hypothetical protein K438DRAFT_1593929 [Mycena galopus ATCC 62051]|nr:hypothetical protein K438DRAFT_1593929 [Mycena galopus ATCC 62051]
MNAAAKSSDPTQRSERRRILFHPSRKDGYRGFTNWDRAHTVIYNGKEYPTSEHLFQALKFMDNRPDIAESIRTISKSPTEAQKYSLARTAHQHPDWDRMATAKMEITMWHKFSQHADLKQLLLATGDAELVNYTTNDFWGVGEDEQGRNEGGKALERVRDGLRKL